MKSFITKEYDFFDAITKNMNLAKAPYKEFCINKVIRVLDDASIVETSHGNFYCESFEDHSENIYMKVTSYI